MDQYHLNESIDYANNMLNSTHHLMNQQHQLQTHQNNQPQYTQLHASNAHRNLNNNNNNNSVLNNQVQLLNGGQKTANGNSTHNNNNNNVQINGNLNANHNGTSHNGHNSNHSINGNANANHNTTVNGQANIGPNTAIVHPTNLHHANAHLNQQLMQLSNAASPPQHQTPTIQHAQMTHDLHSLENSPQLTNLTNSNANNQQPETKYTPPQSLKRKLDEYLEHPQMNNDNLLNDG